MKFDEVVKQELSRSAVSSLIVNFIKQPAVIVSSELEIIKANQDFYDFFELPVTTGNIKNLYANSHLAVEDVDELTRITLKYSDGNIEAIVFNTLQAHEFLILINDSDVRNQSMNIDDFIATRSGKKLYLLDEISDIAYLRVDIEDDTIQHSGYLLQLLDLNEGYSLNYLKDFFNFIHPNDLAQVEQNYIYCKNGKECDEFEVRLLSAEKRLRFLNIKFKNVENKQCLIIVQDNSSQKMLEMALRDNEALFRSIFEQAAVGIAQVSPKGELLMFNQKFCDILGYDRENLMAVNYLKLTYPEDVDNDVEVMNEMFANHLDEIVYEKRFLHKTGKPIWTKAHITVIRNEQNFPRYAVGIIDDISDRKNAEQQIIRQNEDLIRLNSEMDNFVYRTSHDLRAPLASVMGLVQLLKKETNEVQKSQYMQMIEKSIKRLDNSIHEILDLSRNSRMDFEYKNISLANLINNILSDLAHIKGFEKLEIRTNIEDKDFYSDDKRLKMIFNNLLSNAIIYHNPYIDDPYIRITAEVDSKSAKITVEDNGLGIEEKHLQNIFKMFYRANDSITGSGLGLYIVKEAVEKLKGTIEVTSKAGAGTCFRLNLPNIKMNITT